MIELERKLANSTRYTQDKNHFHEVYYVQWLDPVGDYVGWLRYTLTNSVTTGQEAAIWATFIHRSDASKNIAIQQRFLINQTTIASDQLELIIDKTSGITDRHIWGSVAEGDAQLSWDLKIERDGIVVQHIPTQLHTGNFPSTKFVAPQCGCRLSGSFNVNGRIIELNNVKGLVAHFWGTKHVATWAWANCLNFNEDPNFYFDGVSARMRLGSYFTPAMTCLFFYWEDKLYACNNLLSAFVSNKSQYDLSSWQFSAKKDDYQFSGKITSVPEKMLLWQTNEEDDNQKKVHLTFCADITIDIAKRTRSGWKKIKTMTANHACTYENAYEYHDQRVKWIVG